MSLKQDRTGTRTSEDLRRRINIKGIDEAVKETDENSKAVKEMETRVNGISESLDNTRKNYISTQTQKFTEEQKTRARDNIGAGNSSFSGSYNDLSNIPTDLVKDAKYVHTDNNYSISEKNKLAEIENKAEVNKIEKIKVNGIEQDITNKEVDITFNPTLYDLSSYKESDLTILRSSCIEKNKRVCVNFVGSINITANNTTTLFTFPIAIRPIETKDFVVFGQTNNNDGYIGYGYLTNDGLLQVRFNVDITSYIRFSFVYDL